MVIVPLDTRLNKAKFDRRAVTPTELSDKLEQWQQFNNFSRCYSYLDAFLERVIMVISVLLVGRLAGEYYTFIRWGVVEYEDLFSLAIHIQRGRRA